jgi:hypothetical protein
MKKVCQHKNTYTEYTVAGNFIVCGDCAKVLKEIHNGDYEFLLDDIL